MAEIHVQTKRKSAGWLWIVLGLLVLGALAYLIVMRTNKNEPKNTTNQSAPSSYVLPVHAEDHYHLS